LGQRRRRVAVHEVGAEHPRLLVGALRQLPTVEIPSDPNRGPVAQLATMCGIPGGHYT